LKAQDLECGGNQRERERERKRAVKNMKKHPHEDASRALIEP
jgi:hypothetical protein